MGYRLNRLDEPVFKAVPKPMLTEVGIHHRLESCDIQPSNSFFGSPDAGLMEKYDLKGHNRLHFWTYGLINPLI